MLRTDPSSPMTAGGIAFSTAEYAQNFLRRYSLAYWLVGGPDYSRSVEYPLVSQVLQAQPGQRLLDVGAGRMAEFATLMADRGVEVTAIDPRDDVGADTPGVNGLRLVKADARDLDFPDGEFDRVTAISTIEHIEEGDDTAMKELARVLRPGGRLVVTVPYNPLKRAQIFARDDVYGRRGERVLLRARVRRGRAAGSDHRADRASPRRARTPRGAGVPHERAVLRTARHHGPASPPSSGRLADGPAGPEIPAASAGGSHPFRGLDGSRRRARLREVTAADG